MPHLSHLGQGAALVLKNYLKVEVLLRNLLSTSTKLRIYETYILSELTYCQKIWPFCRSLDSRKVERLHEKASIEGEVFAIFPLP